MSYDKFQFYPTPNYLALQMVMKIKEKPKLILEPSAGDGQILRAIKKRWYSDVSKHWFEIDKTKHEILSRESRYGKQGDDFLQSDMTEKYDAVIMNPPFNRGEDHILRAYEALKKGGQLVCLISSATLDGKTLKESKINKILELEEAEVEDLEDVFSRSEAKRKTGVQCSLITLTKTYGERQEFDALGEGLKENFNPLATISKNTEEAKVKVYNYIESLVDQYNTMIEEFDKVCISSEKLFKTKPSFVCSETMPSIPFRSDFKANLTSAFWSNIFRKTEMSDYMTSMEKDRFKERQERQGEKLFTQENIAKLMLELINSSSEIIERSVRHIFNCITSNHYHSNKFEGWKTNKHDKVDKKLIIPNVACYKFGQSFDYRKDEYLVDIEKSLCLIIGKKFSDISINYKSTIQHSLHYAETGVWHDSYFFKCKIFKKGTLHLTWKSEELRQKFNQIACNGLKNIGGDFK